MGHTISFTGIASQAVRSVLRVSRMLLGGGWLLAMPVMAVGQPESWLDRLKPWLLGTEVQANVPEVFVINLDPISVRCLGCHNGSKGVRINVKSADQPLQIRGFQTVNHPMGMVYEDYAGRDPFGYHPQAAVEDTIPLIEGKVGCSSCHKLKPSRLQHPPQIQQTAQNSPSCLASSELTVGPRETDLCLTCHIK